MGVPLSGVQESYSFLQKCDMFTGFPGIEKRIFYKKKLLEISILFIILMQISCIYNVELYT